MSGGTPRFDKLLVLDLDETLVHATEECLTRAHDFLVGRYFVYRRPHLSTFLSTCFQWFHVGIWTSASIGYATEVVSHIVAEPGMLEFLWGAERCTWRRELDREYWLKNLEKVARKDFALERVIAVDDSPEKFSRHYGNLVCVRAYEGEAEDRELPLLLRYLERLGPVENVRTIEKRGWRSEV